MGAAVVGDTRVEGVLRGCDRVGQGWDGRLEVILFNSTKFSGLTH